MYIPNQHELVADAFEKGYNKADMQESFLQLTRNFVRAQMQLLTDEGVPDKVILIGTQSSFTKRELALFVTLPYLDKHFFEGFKNSLPTNTAKLLDELVWEEKMTQKEIERKLDIQLFDIKKSTYSGYEQYILKKDFRYFRHANIHKHATLRRPEYILYIEPSVRRIINIYYDQPKGTNLEPIEAIEETSFVYDRGETDILLEIPRLQAYAQQGNIKVSTKGKPAIGTLSKMQRKLNLAEFYPNDEAKMVRLIRSNLLAGLITTLGSASTNSGPEVLIKMLIQSYYVNRYRALYQLLPHLKGTAYTDEYYVNKVEHHFVHLLSQLPEGRWIAIDNILRFLKFSFIDIRPVKDYIARNKLYYDYEATVQYEHYAYRENKHYIDANRYDEAIMIPTLKGNLFLFAAFGLLDVAYDKIDGEIMGQTADSPYDGLKYVRLTKLGAYVSGQNTQYEPPADIGASTIELSEDSLTITSSKNDTTAAIVLEPFTQKVTPNRFRTDYSIFLYGVTSQEELAGKIRLFKQAVTTELPPNWEHFFGQLSKKIDPLKKVTTMIVFKIPEDSPELTKLIARDAKLKSMCLKAEGYHILVERKKFAAFKNRLREFGYLLSR
ncbi:MAG: hypothetical protein AAGJ18_15785 [Bacteroidota bacterium]